MAEDHEVQAWAAHQRHGARVPAAASLPHVQPRARPGLDRTGK